jgi:ketosteroid isomerase-like protein
MNPSAAERDQIFKTFGRAWFKQDLDLMFQVVTPDFVWISPGEGEPRRAQGREQVAAEFARRRGLTEGVRFHDVVYHHADDASFMTFRITGTMVATGKPFETAGVERYTFRDGKLAVKDVYTRTEA